MGEPPNVEFVFDLIHLLMDACWKISEVVKEGTLSSLGSPKMWCRGFSRPSSCPTSKVFDAKKGLEDGGGRRRCKMKILHSWNITVAKSKALFSTRALPGEAEIGWYWLGQHLKKVCPPYRFRQFSKLSHNHKYQITTNISQSKKFVETSVCTKFHHEYFNRKGCYLERRFC